MGDLRLYQDADFEQIKPWFESRGLTLPNKHMLPHLGLIAENVACGFMYVADQRLGWLDFFISNPESSAEKRGQALDAISSTLIDIAKRRKLKGVMTNTRVEAIKKRALSHNFKNMGECTMLFRGF